jgi:hypothetical protein
MSENTGHPSNFFSVVRVQVLCLLHLFVSTSESFILPQLLVYEFSPSLISAIKYGVLLHFLTFCLLGVCKTPQFPSITSCTSNSKVAVTVGKIGTHLWNISAAHPMSDKFLQDLHDSISPAKKVVAWLLHQLCFNRCLVFCQAIGFPSLSSANPPYRLALLLYLVRCFCQYRLATQHKTQRREERNDQSWVGLLSWIL